VAIDSVTILHPMHHSKPHAESQAHWSAWPYGQRKWSKPAGVHIFFAAIRAIGQYLVYTHPHRVPNKGDTELMAASLLILSRFSKCFCCQILPVNLQQNKKGSLYSITELRVPELIPVLGSQPAGDVSHKPGSRLPLLSARLAVSPATLKGCYQFCCLVNRGTMGVNSLPKTVT